jgi:hypothetical protein
MGQIEKLLRKLASNPNDFEYSELRRIMLHFGYKEKTGGKTSGSRMRFADNEGHILTIHKRHPQKELLPYQVDDVLNHLKARGLI